MSALYQPRNRLTCLKRAKRFPVHLGKMDPELQVHPERWTGTDLDETGNEILVTA